MRHEIGIRLFLVMCIAWLTTACAMKIVDLNPPTPPSGHLDLPFADSLAVERLRVSEENSHDDASAWQHDLAKVLREEGLFQTVSSHGSPRGDVDLVLRGEVGGKFRSNGFLNFITWWPGPILFMPSWRGNRYFYDASADVELIDTRTEQVVARYHAEASHRLTHAFYNPVPFLGAIAFFPGIVKGALSARPRAAYRKRIYPQSYSALWQQVAAQIAADRGPHYAEQKRRRRERCGDDVDALPVIGTEWPEFAACQTGRFRASREDPSPVGIVREYVNRSGNLKVHVVDGQIVRWSALETLPAVGTAPRK